MQHHNPSPHEDPQEEHGDDPDTELLVRPLERLLASTTPQDRDDVLLQTALDLSAARAAALWRASGPNAPLARICSAGELDLLPSADEVEACRSGEANGLLPFHRDILVAELDDGIALLALGAVGQEQRVDLLEAHLRMGACVTSADEELAAENPGPLPEYSDASAELRAIFDAVATARADFARSGVRLSVEVEDELLQLRPQLGERRLFHLIRSLLAEARTTAPRGSEVSLRCTASPNGDDLGWELAGSATVGLQASAVFRMWLPV